MTSPREHWPAQPGCTCLPDSETVVAPGRTERQAPSNDGGFRPVDAEPAGPSNDTAPDAFGNISGAGDPGYSGAGPLLDGRYERREG